MGSKAADKLAEITTFLKVWFKAPKTVGAILPTSATSGRKMVSVIDHSSCLPVLEIGPGTGAITRQILSSGTRPDNLVALEVDPTFVRTLRERFPGIRIVQGDAFDLHSTFSRHGPVTFDTIISAMPLVTHPVEKRLAFLRQALPFSPGDGRLSLSAIRGRHQFQLVWEATAWSAWRRSSAISRPHISGSTGQPATPMESPALWRASKTSSRRRRASQHPD